MPDARTNTTIEGMAHALRECSSFAITGHVNPDGDCLGSQLALAHALRELGKEATVLLAEDSPVEEGLRFLPGFDGFMPAGKFGGSPEAFVCVDVSVRDRIKESAAVMDRANRVFVIDHHEKPEIEAELLYDDSGAASCSMIVWEVIAAMGVKPTPDIALCAYTGLMTDTGRFQYQNTDPRAFELAAQMVHAGARPALAAREFFQSRSLASMRMEQRMISHMQVLQGGRIAFSMVTLEDFAECDARNADAEMLIDTLRSLGGVHVACLLKEREGFVRGSLRAKDDESDVASIARALGGGGHKAAAGFTLEMPLDQAVERVMAELEAYGGGSA